MAIKATNDPFSQRPPDRPRADESADSWLMAMRRVRELHETLTQSKRITRLKRHIEDQLAISAGQVDHIFKGRQPADAVEVLNECANYLDRLAHDSKRSQWHAGGCSKELFDVWHGAKQATQANKSGPGADSNLFDGVGPAGGEDSALPVATRPDYVTQAGMSNDDDPELPGTAQAAVAANTITTLNPLEKAPAQPLLRKPPGFEDVFPFDRSQVSQLFVEPTYKHDLYSTAQRSGPWDGTDFLADALRLVNVEGSCLVISGPYGSGKTFLAKYLTLSGGLGEVSQVAFLTARQLAANLRGAKTKKSTPISLQGVKALVIDAFDELLIDKADDYNSVLDCLTFAAAARKGGHPVVFTLRVSDANSIQEAAVDLINVMFDNDIYDLHFLHLAPFTKPQIAHWLENYARGQAEAESALTTTVINRLHKRLIVATQIPLFLYILGQSYYRSGPGSIEDIYGIYENFVAATTSGRFRRNQDSAFGATWALAEAYEGLLESVATSINNSRHARQKDHPPQESDTEWLLDENTDMHAIPLAEVQSTISEADLQLLEENAGGSQSRSSLTLQVLNNYFFARSGQQIGFKDNNILFFLVARRLYRAISSLATSIPEEMEHHLGIISETKAHPQAVEVMLKRLDRDGAGRRRELAKVLQQLVSEKRIIQITPLSLESISAATINRDIVLSLVLLHVKRTFSDMEYFLTRLAWLTSAVKMHDAMYRHLIARSFRNINLEGLEFRRLNCDEFNFSSSKIKDVLFIQCKLFDARFNQSDLQGTKFKLCDFGISADECDFSGFTGELRMSQCAGGNLRILDLSESVTIDLDRCKLDILRISCTSLSTSKSVNLKIRNSSVGSLLLENVYLAEADLRGTGIELVSDKNSKGRMVVDTNVQVKWSKRTGSLELVHGAP